MNNKRTPKKDEVWVGTGDKRDYTCVLDVPDDFGYYVWKGDNGRYTAGNTHSLVPRPEPAPELTYWVNVYLERGSTVLHSTAEKADLYAQGHRIGRMSATGEWVPCRGREVL